MINHPDDIRIRPGAAAPETFQNCPEEELWYEVAAGVMEIEAERKMLDHAAGCARCGPLLLGACTVMDPASTAEENSFIEAGPSLSWRPEVSSKKVVPIARGWRSWAAAAAVVLASWIGFSAWRAGRAPANSDLLARAYADNRTMDFRIPGGRHGEIRRVRGEGKSSDASLLEAMGSVAKGLRESPDDRELLKLRARSELLSLHPDEAIVHLDALNDAASPEAEILHDLGVAYALRAVEQNRDADLVPALDYLSRALRLDGGRAETWFNRALVQERLALWEAALDDWRAALRLESDAAWRVEIQARTKALEQRVAERKKAESRVTDDPAEYVRLARSGLASDSEFYLDSPVGHWLQHAQEAAPAGALRMLAEQLRREHRDPWLADALRAGGKFDALGEAIVATLERRFPAAIAASRQAQQDLALNKAARLRALREEAVALLVTREPSAVLEVASRLKADAYPLLNIQAAWVLASARFRLTRFGDAWAETENGVLIADRHGYAGAGARARTLQLDPAYDMASRQAWTQGASIVRALAALPARPVLRTQAISYLSRRARADGWPQAAVAFQRAAMQLSAGMTPRDLAAARIRLGEAAGSAGDHAEAESSFRTVVETLERESNKDGVNSSPMMEEAALGRLEALIAQARWSEAATLAGRVDNRFSEAGRLTLLRQRARIRAEGGDWREAKQDLATAWASSWESDPARVAAQLPFALARLMAELELRHQGDARLALAYLERTRAAALGVSLSDTEAMRRLDALPDALSIHILGNRIGIWRLRGGKVQFAWSPVPVAAVSETAARFFRNCADPTSPVEQIERDGRRLFDWLIAPVGGEPGNAGSITVSLDEALSGLPLQALRDSRGWWQAAARMTPALVLTAEPSMEDMRSFGSFVIVAEPSLPASLRQNFPALPEATAEATWLAAHVPGKPIVLQGQAATVKRIRDELSTVDAFHFAGHGIGNGGAGGLLTASGELLTARDVTGSGSRTRGLAVLAACASLGGRLAGATASDGLVTAFLRAGFRNVVASRWNSDSLATAGIIRRFYEQLWNGVGPSESLTLGTSVIRNDKRTAHPYYWANLQEIGT